MMLLFKQVIFSFQLLVFGGVAPHYEGTLDSPSSKLAPFQQAAS